MNFTASFHKKAFGSIAAICLFSAATCAFITFSTGTTVKQVESSFALFRAYEPTSCFVLINSEKKQSIKKNAKDLLLSSSRNGKNSLFQKSKNFACLSFDYAYSNILRPLKFNLTNSIYRLQDYGLISIRKIE